MNNIDNEAREEFRNLVNSGRRYCYFLLESKANGQHQLAIIVENHPCIFPLDRMLGTDKTAAEVIVYRMNATRLKLSTEQAHEIVCSSIRHGVKAMKQATDGL